MSVSGIFSRQPLSYSWNAEQIGGGGENGDQPGLKFTGNRLAIIYLYYCLLASFSLRSTLKGLSMIAPTAGRFPLVFRLQEVDFMFSIFEQIGLTMGPFYFLVVTIWTYSGAVYCLQLHRPDVPCWRRAYDLTVHNSRLLIRAALVGDKAAKSQLQLQKENKQVKGKNRNNSAAQQLLKDAKKKDPPLVETLKVSCLVYYKVLPLANRRKLLQWLMLSELFMFGFICSKRQ
ncbi:hypothetical protein TYRP_021734 [Tyrophagus putrescentiae]|nr:hypothetical protein TYRP_021734 [Tyrophagus putrescentiae]